MSSQCAASIRSTLNGQRYELSREGVENGLIDVAPGSLIAAQIEAGWVGQAGAVQRP